ncbi:uncharacterized protein LOC110961441 [Acanthochromis polyacanthus]|uniref:uncharacterized protein LOC110961441 n=1 Tax=Acanthochromis polyacanthus TaxID=80966 RepID=UPI002234176D|nr:uncharacterized protein LOC110961441 [Acanthochromis polyacanthus]
MRTGLVAMHEGPLAALPLQEQPDRHVYHQAVDVSLDDRQVQVPVLTQGSSSPLRSMSELVPLLHCALDPAASHATKWKVSHVDNCSMCNTTEEGGLKQNGQCECSKSSDLIPGTGQDTEVADLDCGAAVHSNSQMEAQTVKYCDAVIPQQQEGSPTDASCPAEMFSTCSPVLGNYCDKHLPASASDDCSLDVLRIVKHKPSAIVFCDYDNQVITVNESSDDTESSSSTSKEGEDDDDVPETLQYKEFLVSRRRRNLSRNRKGLRRRQDAQPSSTASAWQKPSNTGKPEFTGSQEEEDTWQNNGKQAAACDSMTLLMKKLDHLNEENPEGQSANSSHSYAANADPELQSTTQ